MFQKILVGVDASDESTKALRVAANLTKIFMAELHIFHAVVHYVDFPQIRIPHIVPFAMTSPIGDVVDSAPLHASYEQAGKDIIADAQEYLKRLQLGIESQCFYHLEIDVSPEQFAVDLIILGYRGHHSRVRNAILGTVPTKIINEAPCQVLIVR